MKKTLNPRNGLLFFEDLRELILNIRDKNERAELALEKVLGQIFDDFGSLEVDKELQWKIYSQEHYALLFWQEQKEQPLYKLVYKDRKKIPVIEVKPLNQEALTYLKNFISHNSL